MTRNLKRFLVTSSLKKNKSVSLNQEETHHLRRVLHMKEGMKCILFDQEGNECLGVIEGFGLDSTQVKLIEPIMRNSETGFKLSVAQAIPQDRKMDDIVQKSAELGIDKLIPLITERTIVRIKENQFQKVNERWNRILNQAAKQSRVSKLPQIKPITSFKDLISTHSECDHIFLLHPSKEAKPIRTALSVIPAKAGIQSGSLDSSPSLRLDRAGSRFRGNDKILLIIGPEGGFSDQEVKLAESKGAELISMGREIMRTDTAFVAAASFIKLMSRHD